MIELCESQLRQKRFLVATYEQGGVMATTASRPAARHEIDYPTSDGRPLGETDLHRSVMFDTINTLIDHFAGQPVYVTGNLLLFYEEGNRRKHVSPDCMVVRGAEEADAARQAANAARLQAEAENLRLQAEIAELRHKLGGAPS